MDNLNKYLPSKMVYIATSMYSISTIFLWCMWTYKVKNNNNTKPNPSQAKKKEGFGLKTLIIEPESKLSSRYIHSYTMSSSERLKPSLPQPLWKLQPPQPPQRLSTLWATSPPPLLPTVSFELIGTESGDCMMYEIEDYIEIPNSEGVAESSRRTREKSGISRKFPPPISVLREALVLKREGREDGRVVMTLIQKEDGDDMELEFNGEPQEWTCANDGVREEKDDEEEEEGKEEKVALASSSSSSSSGRGKEEEKGELRRFSISYSGYEDSNSSWKDGIVNGLVGLPASAPLFRPIQTPVN